MPLLEWEDQFSTGMAALDHEHRRLIDLINTLYAQVEETGAASAAVGFLGELYAEIASHFALEETLMRERRYAELAAHKDDHERLLDAIRDIMDACAGGAYERHHEVLGEHLRHWFGRHFGSFDARLHGVLGGPPLRR
jgi:hemerythrin